MTRQDELSDDDVDRLTSGTLEDSDVPEKYGAVDTPIKPGIVDIPERSGVIIGEPEHRDTSISLHPVSVPERGVPMIDFYHGRPYLYLYTPLREEVQYVFALPTKENPELEVKKTPASR